MRPTLYTKKMDKRVQVRISDDTYEKLEYVARQNRVTVNDLARRLLENDVEKPIPNRIFTKKG